MIIRNDVQRTLKASPLNNRSVRRTSGQLVAAESTLEECPSRVIGRLFQSRCSLCRFFRGASHRQVIERRRFQRPNHLIADNQLKAY